MFSRKIFKPVEIPKFDLRPIKLQRLAFIKNSCFHSDYLCVEPNVVEEIKFFKDKFYPVQFFEKVTQFTLYRSLDYLDNNTTIGFYKYSNIFNINTNLIDWIGQEFDTEEFLNYHEVIKVTRK